MPKKIQDNALIRALISSGSADTIEEANYIFDEMQTDVYYHMIDPEDVLFDYGLEPDYVFDLLSHD